MYFSRNAAYKQRKNPRIVFATIKSVEVAERLRQG